MGSRLDKRKAVNDPLSLECIEHVSFAKNKAAIFQVVERSWMTSRGMLIGDGKQE